MDALRRSLIVTGVLGISGVLAGCITQTLMEPHEYKESVSAVLISKDGKKLVIISKEFHYIFDVPDVLVKAVTSDFHSDVRADLGYFDVDMVGRISGGYSLIVSKDATDAAKATAISAGFKKSYDGSLTASGTLTGTRYASNGIQLETENYPLNQKYSISVRVEQAQNEKSAKLLVTPITRAADGVLTIAAIPLVFAAAMLLCPVKGCKK